MWTRAEKSMKKIDETTISAVAYHREIVSVSVSRMTTVNPSSRKRLS